MEVKLTAEPVKELPYWFKEKYNKPLGCLRVFDIDGLYVGVYQLIDEMAKVFPDLTVSELAKAILWAKDYVPKET